MNSKPLYELRGARILEYGEDRPVIRTAPQATDLIGEALQAQAHWVYLPAARLSEAFFELKSGLAGEVVQKFANYQIALAIVGDIPTLAAASRSLRDFMREANRGRDLWFVADRGEFQEKLKYQRGAMA
jgi:Domain of unknown function (DUF4180)